MTKVKAGLIQMSLKGTVGADSPDTIKKKMINAHAELIAKAAAEAAEAAAAAPAPQAEA